jgi:RNA polymerase primary sigma factor
MINQEQEIELAKRIKLGDKIAEAKLIKANLRFVVSVAKKYARADVQLEDLINEGNIGLIKAAQRFDETRGFKFISYAVWWIRQSILEAYPVHYRSVRVPLNVQASYDKIRKWSTEFEQKNEREPSVMEICEQFDIENSSLNKMVSHFNGEHSLDSKVRDDDEGTFADLLSSGNIDVYDSIEKENMSAILETAMDTCLSHMEKEILCLSFGIGIERREGLTNEEIGNKFMLTGERIRQIKEKALRKIRNSSRCKRLFREI